MMVIHVDGTRVCIENYQPFVQGTVGLQANVQLSEEWDGLTVTAVFATADNFDTRYPVSTGSGTITIPWEVLSEARAHPLLSFDGRDSGGNLIRRSSICDLGEVAPSMDPLGETPTPTPPYPDWYENVFEAGQQALQSAQDAEAYAKGTRSGTEVGTTDPAYHNNSKYFKEQAEAVRDSIPADYTELADDVSDLKSAISQKQDAPSSAGTAGQVLGLDSNLDPVWVNQSGDGGGTTDYAQLSNKPTINNVELSGNKTLAELGINAGSVGFDETGTYADGSIGAGVSNQKNALNFTNQGALDYALNYDIDLFKFLKWTKGQYVDNSNGSLINNSRFYISDPIEVSDLKSDYLHLVITNSFTFKYAQYDANGDFLLGGSYGSAVDRVLSIRDTCKTIRFSVGAWSGTYTLSDYLNAITIYVKPAHNVVIEDYIGYEELDFLYDKYIVTPSISTANVSTTPVSFNQCVCLSTPCTKGQVFTITGTPRDNSGSRPVMFLDQANTCIYRSDEASAFNNVEITAPVTGTLVVNFLKAYPFQCYTGFKNLSEKIFKNLDSVNTIKSFPVDIIPDWLTNAMAIRTVGPLQKGYICLTCDDGATELESYTIPMLLNKQVPCTFGLWASTSKVGAAHPFNKSPVLQTPSGIAAVKNAITAGCSVAQHGPHEWTDMTNEFLNEFFDREAAAWEALEIDVKGAICPSHCINNAVRVTAGGRFGVVRSGYRGYLSKADQQAVINGDVFAEYNYYCTGPRSNVFGLSSFNTNAVTLSWMKGAVDFAIAQKMILVAYWHDWDLTAEQKSDLEAFIDYAKAQNITFCTLGDIPTLK